MTTGRTLRVLEISSTLAGAVCGRLFAGLGHDVILIEGADPGLRASGPFTSEGVSLTDAALNADKRCLAGITASGLTDAAWALFDRADVLVLDLVPSRADALGLDPDHLRQRFPGLVVVSVTGFGRGTELSELPSDCLLAESYGGLATMIGQAGRRPLSLGGHQVAYCAGVTAFLAALLGLMRRRRDRSGDVADVALCDVAAYMDWKSDVSLFMTGRSPERTAAGEGDWRLLQCRDGWVGMIYLPRHWPAVVELVGDDALRAPDLADDRVRASRPDRWWPVVERWAAALPAEEIYRRAQELGLPFGWVVRMSDVVASEQLQDRGFVPATDSAWRKLAAVGAAPAAGSPFGGRSLAWRSGAAPSRSTTVSWHREETEPAAGDQAVAGGDLPLQGVVVLDFGTITAGAAVTRLLADHGATIIKVESAERADTFRTWKLSPAEVDRWADAGQRVTSPYFPSNNVGKQDVAIDLKTPEGRELVRRLARRCQVVVENFRVGVTTRLGIDEPTLRAENPHLIYLSLSSQGQHGPESRFRSFGSTLDLLSGLASFTGYEDGRPLWSSYEVNYPDQLVSLLGAAALVYCLHQQLTGVHLDVSQREVVSWTLGPEIANYLCGGQDSSVTGNRRPGVTPRDTYPTRDRAWVAVACVTDADRSALAGWLGRPDVADRDQQWWIAHADEIDAAIRRRTTASDRDELAAGLRIAGVPAVPVLTAADRATAARFADRQVVFEAAGSPVKGFPMTFADYRPAVHMSAPALGEHTRDVLREFCDLTEVEIERLRSRGVVDCAATPVSSGRPQGAD
jgi:crotonobetainyl-CoA:carnitine CoA-transferase CaiB-like acyl-CoA transferase